MRHVAFLILALLRRLWQHTLCVRSSCPRNTIMITEWELLNLYWPLLEISNSSIQRKMKPSYFSKPSAMLTCRNFWHRYIAVISFMGFLGQCEIVFWTLHIYMHNQFTEKRWIIKTLTCCFQDVPLFEGIISDLFPGVELPKPDFGVFLEALKENIAKRKLQAVPWFIDKIIQVCSACVCCQKF